MAKQEIEVLFACGELAYSNIPQIEGLIYFDTKRKTIHLDGKNYYPVKNDDTIIFKDANGILLSSFSVVPITTNLPTGVSKKYKFLGVSDLELGSIEINDISGLKKVYIGSNQSTYDFNNNMAMEPAISDEGIPAGYEPNCLVFVYSEFKNGAYKDSYIYIPVKLFFSAALAGNGIALSNGVFNILKNTTNDSNRYLKIEKDSISLRNIGRDINAVASCFPEITDINGDNSLTTESEDYDEGVLIQIIYSETSPSVGSDADNDDDIDKTISVSPSLTKTNWTIKGNVNSDNALLKNFDIDNLTPVNVLNILNPESDGSIQHPYTYNNGDTITASFEKTLRNVFALIGALQDAYTELQDLKSKKLVWANIKTTT